MTQLLKKSKKVIVILSFSMCFVGLFPIATLAEEEWEKWSDEQWEQWWEEEGKYLTEEELNEWYGEGEESSSPCKTAPSHAELDPTYSPLSSADDDGCPQDIPIDPQNSNSPPSAGGNTRPFGAYLTTMYRFK